MSFDFRDRVAVVTGGSSGIGLATCAMFLRNGAKVAFCGRNKERLAAASARLQEQFGAENLIAEAADVLKSEDCERLRHAVERRFGSADYLVNNAGQGRVSTFADTSDEDLRDELELKFFSIIRPVRAFLPLLERSSAPSIVCVNSLLALQPEPHMVATSAARAGVLNLTHSLAIELAPRIRVNSVLIGLVESAQWKRRYEARQNLSESWQEWTSALARGKKIPLGRLGLPEEAAAAIVFLASPLSSYTTGSHIDISGGLSRHV